MFTLPPARLHLYTGTQWLEGHTHPPLASPRPRGPLKPGFMESADVMTPSYRPRAIAATEAYTALIVEGLLSLSGDLHLLLPILLASVYSL